MIKGTGFQRFSGSFNACNIKIMILCNGTTTEHLIIQYLTDDNAHLKNEGWSVMDDPFYEGKQILFKDYSGQLDDEVFSSSGLGLISFIEFFTLVIIIQ